MDSGKIIRAKRTGLRKSLLGGIGLIIIVVACIIVFNLIFGTGTQMAIEDLARALKGVPATMTTYAFDGTPLDRVKGDAFRPSRDNRFDTTDAEGNTTSRGSVIMVSLGNSHISHVGSTLIIEQKGIERLTDAGTRIDIENHERGRPWLNDLVEYWRNKTIGGKSKIIFIRSQNSTPLAVYAGNKVEITSTDVPNSTLIRIDGKYLFVYRCEYTIYDTDLLGE